MQTRRTNWTAVTMFAAAGGALANVAAAQSEEIRKYAEQDQWPVEYENSAETRKWMDEESARLKEVLTALGRAKRGS